MSRIPSVAPQDASLLVRIGYRLARRRVGEVPEPFAVTAHHPKLFMAAARHELAVEKATQVVPRNIVQLAVYRTAWTVGCSWCVDFGTMLIRHDGLDADRLKHIADFETSDAYSDEERDAIRYADAMTSTPMRMTTTAILGV